MRRTQVSSATARRGLWVVCLGLLLGGCAAPTASSAGPAEFIDRNGTTLEPGETGTVSMTIRNVGELHPQDIKKDGVVLRTENITATPETGLIYTTLPPYWSWPSVESQVTMTVPVRATQNATPGTYQFEFVAWNSTEHDHVNGATGNITVTVTSNTSG